MNDHERRQPPAAPDFSRENVVWARYILLSAGLIFGVLLFALALPSLRERFF